jgi:uncharacterized protein (TIGR02246 family)
MTSDEAAIREYYDNWIRATREGLTDLGLSLVDDDAVFVMPSAPKMDKHTFVSAACAGDPEASEVEFDLKTDIHEIKVMGDYAWLWTEFTLVTTHKETGDKSKCGGHTLSILKRNGDSWLLVRDANTMAQMPVE